MREKDYIIATDLTKVRMAKRILSDIVPDIYPKYQIETEEYRTVLKILSSWEEKLNKQM